MRAAGEECLRAERLHWRVGRSANAVKSVSLGSRWTNLGIAMTTPPKREETTHRVAFGAVELHMLLAKLSS